MADAAASARRKVGEILALLEKVHGKVHPLPLEPPLDHAVFLILREQWDYRKAQKALQVFQQEFVDWNEVRAATAGELCDVLATLGDKNVAVKIEKIRTLLQYVWRERNCVSLEFLRRMDFERQVRFLEGSGVLTAGQVQVILQALRGETEFLVSPHAVRVLHRVGILPRVYSDSGARKILEKLVDREQIYSFQAHVVQHGEDICQLKSPRCGDCGIVARCSFKRKVGLHP